MTVGEYGMRMRYTYLEALRRAIIYAADGLTLIVNMPSSVPKRGYGEQTAVAVVAQAGGELISPRSHLLPSVYWLMPKVYGNPIGEYRP